MAASAFDQAQSLAQQFQQAQQQQGPQAPAPNQLPEVIRGTKPITPVGAGQAAGDAAGIGASFQQHAQNPQVQNALNAIGQFLGQISHPLAGFFAGVANGTGAAVGPAGQAVGAGAQGAMNMYQQAAQGSQGQTLNTQPGMTAPGTGPIGQSLTGGNPAGMGQQPLHLGGR